MNQRHKPRVFKIFVTKCVRCTAELLLNNSIFARYVPIILIRGVSRRVGEEGSWGHKEQWSIVSLKAAAVNTPVEREKWELSVWCVDEQHQNSNAHGIQPTEHFCFALCSLHVRVHYSSNKLASTEIFTCRSNDADTISLSLSEAKTSELLPRCFSNSPHEWMNEVENSCSIEQKQATRVAGGKSRWRGKFRDEIFACDWNAPRVEAYLHLFVAKIYSIRHA